MTEQERIYLQTNYVQAVVTEMDRDELEQFAFRVLNDSFSHESDEDFVEEVEHYMPHLL